MRQGERKLPGQLDLRCPTLRGARVPNSAARDSYDEATWACSFNASGYRLPTEAEWEYAARGGLQPFYYMYPWGNTLNGSHANYANSGDPFETGPLPWTTPVGYYDGNQIPSGVDMANGYGLYDMAGNVWEWCWDWYYDGYYQQCFNLGVVTNPTGPASGQDRIYRGGSWTNGSSDLRTALRELDYPHLRFKNYGFRVVAAHP